MEFEGCGNSTKKGYQGRTYWGGRGEGEEKRSQMKEEEVRQRGPEPEHRNPQERLARCEGGRGMSRRTGAEGEGHANAVSYSGGIGKEKLNQEQKPPMPAWRGVAEAVQGYGEVREVRGGSRILQSLGNSPSPTPPPSIH